MAEFGGGRKLEHPMKRLLLFLIPAVLVAARDVEITGVITDPQAKVVSGAVVSLDRETQRVGSSVSDQEGRFCFFPVVSGTYNLRAEAPGFLP